MSHSRLEETPRARPPRVDGAASVPTFWSVNQLMFDSQVPM